MDTLFRLVSLQSSDQSFNSSRTSSSSRSNLNTPFQECFSLFMDEEDFSSSSSKQLSPYAPPHSPPQQDVSLEFSAAVSGQNATWASEILYETAKALVEGNNTRLHQLIWMLNEMSSPYGDVDQKLGWYFLQALFCRMTDSGATTHENLVSTSNKISSFDSTRKLVLKFQEVCPWTTFGHVASNGAIMEALDGETKLHIIDISSTFCTQWPTLLEAMATRYDETPHLRLTNVIASKSGEKVMKEVSSRMEKFARLMGVPFKFEVVHHEGDLSELNLYELGIEEDEALAINCIGALHTVPTIGNRRDSIISMFRRLNPRIVTIVEEECDMGIGYEGPQFLKGFQEYFKLYRVYFEALDESFPKTSSERLTLERGAGRSIVDLVACPPENSVERRETAARWSRRMHGGGFVPVAFNEEVCDDVRSLLRRYKEGWSMSRDSTGIFLSWKGDAAVWASAWKPS